MHRPTVIESDGSKTENLVNSVARLARHTEGQKKNCRVTENRRGLVIAAARFVRHAGRHKRYRPERRERRQSFLRGVPAIDNCLLLPLSPWRCPHTAFFVRRISVCAGGE